MKRIREIGPVILTAVTFVVLVLVFTALSLVVSSPDDQVGVARGLGDIPIRELELGVAGTLLGVLALGIYGRGGIAVALLLPALVVLLDLDHLPSFLGIAQPIRPAASLIFLVVDVAITTTILRRVDFGLIVMSAFSGHLGLETGLIPPFSPFSFSYYEVNAYSFPLIAISTILAFTAGHMMRRRRVSVT
ncbi:MAG TPA: hypothetical protein VGR53_06465 [Nitrososphaerales archaeon]|nr:hypothetical protein [Nitrososphaerales archaeon]